MNILSAIVEHIKTWYEGKYIPPDRNDLVIRVCGHYERPLVARILRTVGRFLATYWQWLIPVLVALLAIVTQFLLKH